MMQRPRVVDFMCYLTLFTFGETLTPASGAASGDVPKCHKEPAQTFGWGKRNEHRCGR
jgi:hypothetical protein